MAAWNDHELADMSETSELRIAPRRTDGTLQGPRIIWVVRLDDDVYVRSVNGPEGAWFRGVQARHAGHISAGAVDADVHLEEADHDLDDAIDEAYRHKYGRSSSSVERITSAQARTTTMRLIPASNDEAR